MEPLSIGEYFDVLSQSQKVYTRQLEPVCRKWNLTRSEVDVLLFLYNHPHYNRAADIVTHRGMAKSHVSLSVSTLEQRSLLERRFSETDRRTAHLCLTEPGCTIAAEAKQLQRGFFENLYTGVTEEEFQVWEQVSRKVRRNIEELSKKEKE